MPYFNVKLSKQERKMLTEVTSHRQMSDSTFVRRAIKNAWLAMKKAAAGTEKTMSDYSRSCSCGHERPDFEALLADTVTGKAVYVCPNCGQVLFLRSAAKYDNLPYFVTMKVAGRKT